MNKDSKPIFENPVVESHKSTHSPGLSEESPTTNTTDDPPLSSQEERSNFLLNTLKDVASFGLGSLLLSEDFIRTSLKEKKISKETLLQFIESISKKREVVYSLFFKELSKMLSKLDLAKELEKLLSQYEIELKTKISFHKKKNHGGDTEK